MKRYTHWLPLVAFIAFSADAQGIMMPGAIGNDGSGNFDGSIVASARSQNNSGRVPAAAINGAGLTLTGHTGSNDFGENVNWMPGTGQTTSAWFKVDLGQSYNLGLAQFYNFNTTVSSGNTDRGVQTADIYIFDGAAEPNASNPNLSGSNFNTAGWTLFEAGHLFTKAPGGDNYNTPDILDFGGVSARFVAFDIQSNYGDGSFVGISEIQFFQVVVPEPATMSLLALGSLALLRRRRAGCDR